MDFDINGGRIELTQKGSQSSRHVVFATPSLSHAVSLEFFTSYLRTIEMLRTAGISYSCIQLGGCQFIAKARNMLLTQFLGFPDATDLFFVDDDIGWDPEAVVRMLNRSEDIIAGVYPKRGDPLHFPVELNYTDHKLTANNGLFLALHAPLGFMRIKRRAVEQIVLEEKSWAEDNGDGTISDYFDVFQTGMGADGKWWGEDFAFCQKVATMGIAVWVDPDIIFTHAGRNTWTAGLASTLSAWVDQQMQQEPAIKETV